MTTLQERIQKMTEARQGQRRITWPTSCPTCYADVGQACTTISGKRAIRHRDRPRPARESYR